ncbi:MAG TPA: hypothetical protein VKX49_15835 [Bryobacteraceae bacterium]|nr:hypothetical protein [Bryobacteraceae bacterium]
MARLLFGPLFAVLCTAPLPGQDIAAVWFPTHKGDSWIYQHETRNDIGQGAAHPQVHRWKTEETLFSSVALPEGTLIGKRIRVFDGTPPAQYAPRAADAYLLHNDCIYTNNVDWFPLRHQLAPEFSKLLSDGTVSPDFCFPLEVGKTWGAPHPAQPPATEAPSTGAKQWQVAAIEDHDRSAPGHRRTFHITSISSASRSGTTVDIWFAQGFGVVRELRVQHGTYGEERITLLSFDPALR